MIHLAGENIAARRWSAAQKRRIFESRAGTPWFLADALASVDAKPEVLISASAIGFYGDRGIEVLDETSSAGDGFLAEVCEAWEAATEPARAAGVRVVNMRFGPILSPAGGALGKMLTPFKLGLGGKVGSGRQVIEPDRHLPPGGGNAEQFDGVALPEGGENDTSRGAEIDRRKGVDIAHESVELNCGTAADGDAEDVVGTLKVRGVARPVNHPRPIGADRISRPHDRVFEQWCIEFDDGFTSIDGHAEKFEYLVSLLVREVEHAAAIGAQLQPVNISSDRQGATQVHRHPSLKRNAEKL